MLTFGSCEASSIGESRDSHAHDALYAAVAAYQCCRLLRYERNLLQEPEGWEIVSEQEHSGLGVRVVQYRALTARAQCLGEYAILP